AFGRQRPPLPGAGPAPVRVLAGPGRGRTLAAYVRGLAADAVEVCGDGAGGHGLEGLGRRRIAGRGGAGGPVPAQPGAGRAGDGTAAAPSLWDLAAAGR